MLYSLQVYPRTLRVMETGTVDALDRIAKLELSSRVGSGRIDRYHARTVSMWVMSRHLWWHNQTMKEHERIL